MTTTKSAPVCLRTASAYGCIAVEGPEICCPAGYAAVTARTTSGADATACATAVTLAPVTLSVSALVFHSSATSVAPTTTSSTTACRSKIRRASDQLEPARVLTHTSRRTRDHVCLLYTSDAADEEDSVDLGGRSI